MTTSSPHGPKREGAIVVGELFFASSNDLVYQFDYVGDPKSVVIDLSQPHIWDASTVATLDAIQTKYEAKGNNVTSIGLDDAGQERHERRAGHLAGGHWAAAVTTLTFDFATGRRRRSTAFCTPGAPHPSSPGKDDT